MNRFKVTLLVSLLTMAGMHSAAINAAEENSTQKIEHALLLLDNRINNSTTLEQLNPLIELAQRLAKTASDTGQGQGIMQQIEDAQLKIITKISELEQPIRPSTLRLAEFAARSMSSSSTGPATRTTPAATTSSKAALPAAQTEDEMLAAALGISVAEMQAEHAAARLAQPKKPTTPSSKAALPAAAEPSRSGAGSAAGGSAAGRAFGVAFELIPHRESSLPKGRIPTAKTAHASQYHYGYQGIPTWMEDANCEAVSANGLRFFGLFDGHTTVSGTRGYMAAQYCAANLYQEVAQLLNAGNNPTQALATAFEAINQRYLDTTENQDGTEAVAALVEGNTIYVANTGDSRAVLCSSRGVANQTNDHLLTSETEHARILATGARFEEAFNLAGEEVVAETRVQSIDNPKLTLGTSRSIGDRWFKSAGVIATPDTYTWQAAAGYTLILACDGVWDFMSSEEACTVINNARRAGLSEEKAAERLVEAALEANSYDNISVTVVYF